MAVVCSISRRAYLVVCLPSSDLCAMVTKLAESRYTTREQEREAQVRHGASRRGPRTGCAQQHTRDVMRLRLGDRIRSLRASRWSSSHRHVDDLGSHGVVSGRTDPGHVGQRGGQTDRHRGDRSLSGSPRRSAQRSRSQLYAATEQPVGPYPDGGPSLACGMRRGEENAWPAMRWAASFGCVPPIGTQCVSAVDRSIGSDSRSTYQRFPLVTFLSCRHYF